MDVEEVVESNDEEDEMGHLVEDIQMMAIGNKVDVIDNQMDDDNDETSEGMYDDDDRPNVG